MTRRHLPSGWLEKNLHRKVKRVRGRLIYTIRGVQCTVPQHGWQVLLEREDGQIVTAPWREVKRMVAA